MQKLALNVDDLNVQSFETVPAAPARRGTVRGHETETHDEQGCTDACSLVLTCYTCETCDEACDPSEGPDTQRRIIVYS
jgi:hypothetical protein